MDTLIEYLKVFAVGGALCAAGEILVDKTRLTPARILSIYVVAGVILGLRPRFAIRMIGSIRTNPLGSPRRRMMPRTSLLWRISISRRGEWQEVYEKKAYSKKAFEQNEKFCPSENASDFFPVAKAHNVKGLFCGHDHSNDLTMTYEGVVLGYGVKSGTELSFGVSKTRTYLPSGQAEAKPLQLIGGSLSLLHGDGTFDLKHLYVQEDGLYSVVEETF
jgi:hypothetical protein